ncbi:MULTISPECIES: hypothetical protein [Heyndrickxia]|jgi:hypothetical protein|uniref:Uncharacterized protein n=1 Tax=Heyndrickxia coagulans TaxID=1398 RepID=A0A133KSU1_HEYCO|nr:MULTISPECIES: hypothetical protein [Heyndrickxia]KWZ82585.1 hypothetical protein HMPREF3213_01702 [Heyndrickxia coagulans]KYC86229.1 hypothetical protein B4096_1221 [Heyndrickxia coagulans]MEC2222267.1 hypothetical protein [Weizmannia sp. CD-2023]MED4866929.1 hypothetical protein [Weizmannia sp. CD-2023]MED4891448.1 hypothetical protein [Weizmannia sp. CD-2023]
MCRVFPESIEYRAFKDVLFVRLNAALAFGKNSLAEKRLTTPFQ